jgi:hypothetical protein
VTQNLSIHERARALLNRSVVEDISAEERMWLDLHVDGCTPCSAHRVALLETINGVHSELGSVSASAALVRKTQSAVRIRAAELQRNEERMGPLWIACMLAGLWALLSIPLIWEGTQWLAGHTSVSIVVWQTAAVFVWLMPAGLSVALGVWARGMSAVEG